MDSRDFHAIRSDDDISYRKSGLSIAGMMALGYIALLVSGKQEPVLLVAAAITALGAWLEVRPVRKTVDVLVRAGAAVHRFTNPLLLGLIYILAVTPTAVALRLLGKDVLSLRYDKRRQTYWEQRQGGTFSKSSFRNQF